MKAVHLICRRGPDRKLIGLKAVDPKRHIYESCCWAFTEEQAQSLVGGWVYLHPEGKNATSEFGGVVQAVRSASREGKAVEDGYILTIESRHEGRKQRWRGANHAMAWTSGVIDGSLAHEASEISPT